MVDILAEAKKYKEEEKSGMKQAYESTPEKYHKFIMPLEHSKTMFNFEANNLNDELKDLGVEAWGGKTRIKISKPYMVVSGKVKWFADEHIREVDGEVKQYKYNIKSNINDICKIIKEEGQPPKLYPLVVTIDSELYGELEGESTIHWNKKQALEDAKTSALGRAITQTGIGAIGSGLSSYEEVMDYLNYTDTDNSNNKSTDKSNNKSKSNNKKTKNNKSKKKKKVKSLSDKSEDYKEIEDGITKKQALTLFEIANEDVKLLAKVLKKLDYDTSKDKAIMYIKEKDYEKAYKTILEELDKRDQKK